MEKEIYDFYYTFNEYTSELTIFIIDLDGNEYSVASISDIEDKCDCDRLSAEILSEMGYYMKEAE